MATIIVLIVLAVILFFLGRSFIRDRKSGCSGCPGGCPGCGGGKSCHVK